MFREKVINQVGGQFDHAGRTATGAETTPLTAERQHVRSPERCMGNVQQQWSSVWPFPADAGGRRE